MCDRLSLKSIDVKPQMQIETITFDRVFDVQRRLTSRWAPQRTDFSFESGGKRRFAVQVPGWPRIEVGDTITAVRW